MLWQRSLLLASVIIFAAAFLGVIPAKADRFDDALQAVKAEPKVKDAAWASRSESLPSLIVGVWDDGSSQVGYAQYLCLTLADYGIYGGVVRVLDYGVFLRENGKRKVLGKAWCPKSDE
ncbi:hypothetical protein [Deferrisoma camini]|uniref:hypothetical protein n=1 Tax=Deferrisoma camini TaxID=1035120 RepID=UPI00046D7EBE|nr:hypothetical protein [Deferrisoma camini]